MVRLNVKTDDLNGLQHDKYAVRMASSSSSSGGPGAPYTPKTEASTPGGREMPDDVNSMPSTPLGVRGHSDLRSPGVTKTPTVLLDDADGQGQGQGQGQGHDDGDDDDQHQAPMPDFMTQTDRYGNAITPKAKSKIAAAATNNNANANANVAGNGGTNTNTNTNPIQESSTDETEHESSVEVDACDTLLESLRMMCCCILPDSSSSSSSTVKRELQLQKQQQPPTSSKSKGANTNNPAVYPAKQIVKDDVDVPHHNIRLLPVIPKGDPCYGKKCLVLDLDETLVHSSFRAVAGADFVIPVQIEDVVHFVYVMKRPGVDEFLIEMAKHYEIVIYTASLNKYADPLLDLLDPHKTIRSRLFRESCVYYEGSYVKDLSLLNRDLSQAIIIDNSPASYIFHPDNAIDCSSFIDDPRDRELLQIGSFLKGIKHVQDVRGISPMWREWPNIPRISNVEYPESYEEEERHVTEPLQV